MVLAINTFPPYTMPYDPQKHNRRSIRLKGYDYRRPGLYFVTLCCQDRVSFFGHIDQGKVILNAPGQMVARWYHELENKFPDIRCREMVIMPNHFHCVIEKLPGSLESMEDSLLPEGDPLPGADTQDRPDEDSHKNSLLFGADTQDRPDEDSNSVRADLRVSPYNATDDDADLRVSPYDAQDIPAPAPINGIHQFLPAATGTSLAEVIQWFKTMSTNEYIRGVKGLGWKRFRKRLWQRNYYEHIIRDEAAYRRIAWYILANPQKWEQDRLRFASKNHDPS